MDAKKGDSRYEDGAQPSQQQQNVSSQAQRNSTSLTEMKLPVLPGSLEDILDRPMWTIPAAKTSSDKLQNRSISQHAKGILEDSQSKLKSGTVTVEMLLQLNEKWDTHLFQMLISVSIDHHKFLGDLKSAIKRLHIFKVFLLLLKKFATSLGLPTLLTKANELLRHHEKLALNSLCFYDDVDGWIFPLFPEFYAKTFILMIVQFAIMSSEELINDVFYFKMQQLTRNMTQNSPLEDIYHYFWVPLFDHCCSVADELETETITLTRLNMIFGGTKSADYERTIRRLFLAVEKCHAQCTKDIGLFVDLCTTNDVNELIAKIETKSIDPQCIWVKNLSMKITDWSNLQTFLAEADQLMEALEVYDLDKSLVYPFSRQGIEQNFLNKMLKSITDDENKMLLFFRKSRLISLAIKESIMKLGECKDLVLFIRSKSKDVGEMERFIQIALDIIAGEGAEMQDRLIDLSELCGKFYPLLYQLDSSTKAQDVGTILAVFQQTWESLITHHDPLTLTESCVSNVKWYQFIGQLQGAGEQGTLKQLHDLNEHGKYTVSTTKNVQECTVSLTINSVDPHISKKSWTLDDLHEIESKLVLITRQTSKWVDAKNLFQEMLSRVCQICDVVQKLKEYGHMKYLVWQRTLACSDFVNDLASLDKQIEELEQTLSKWIGYVWRCRYHYPELNYYKTNQLIVLREELTKVDQVENHEISLQVLRLLNSTIGKPLESELIVRKALKDVSLDDESLSVKEEFTTTESAPPPVQSGETNVEPEEISKVSQSLAKVRSYDSMNKLYEESVPLGYPDYLILQALLNENVNDIFDMMEWYVELNDDDIDRYQKEWMVNDLETKKSLLPATESASDSLCNSSAECFDNIDINHVAKYFFKRMENSLFEKTTNVADETNFISLETLGKCLQILAARQEFLKKRVFVESFQKGMPNLIITSADNIFICTLQIYSEGENSALPTFDEVFLCSESTTLEEVTIFWMRVLSNQKNNRIYCLLHGEKLPYLIAEESLDLLKYLSQGNKGYRLVIICNNENEGKSNVISRLYSYRREWNLPRDEDMELLEKFLWHNVIEIKRKSYIAHVNATDVDCDNSQVRIFTSKQAGVGKSFSVRKLKDKLVKIYREKGLLSEKQTQKAVVTLPLHGPEVTADEVLSMLLKEGSDLKSCIIHLDIPIKVLRSIDDIIFCLLILGGLTDSKGNVWRSHPSQLYAIELTLPSTKSYIWKFPQARRAINLLKLFPSTECLTPKQLCDLMTNDSVAIELQTPMYQRVYQYLRMLEQKKCSQLENFTFEGTLEGPDKECLDTIIKHSNLSIPTWKEIWNFVSFLNIQLSACEQSSIIKKVPGLRAFIVDLMITMSRDFATSSMSTESTDNDLVSRRHWNAKMHSYIFFNKNRTSITHVGLKFEKKGSRIVLQDTYTQKEIKVDITPEMFEFLTKSVKIPFQNTSDCPENELIERLLEFMNIKTDKIISPDETFVLTQDNLTKIMAIQTRFRCQIPVVLMGETGCGKTHLIRFMCKFATYNESLKNMFILKVHGGTTEEDVIHCINEAEVAALENTKHNIDTVVFFDEANTSDVISLIKEIMCDGRCRGKLVPPFLKFVAACNPYRRHSNEMIKKIRGAKLGWLAYEEAMNDADKSREVPLRDLVYQVLELPDSMKALIFDFGKLKYETERDYTLQLTWNKLSNKTNISHDCVLAIGEVLADCQNFSKQMKNECSFVSLRDVDRALVLFIYFLEVFTDVFQIEKHNNVDKITKSLLLALSVAYLARMASRNEFITKVLRCIKPPLHPVDLIEYQIIVKKYQEKLLDCIDTENGIAKNAALRENIFMMFVCIELRIPLFLVGKPGSSKSLAKAVIENSLRGKNSKKATMRQFKQIHLHSDQCSAFSTPASITEVFMSAKNFQEKRDTRTFVSVVALDIFAEASPYLPLKALHPFLEDGTDGSGSDDQRIAREKRVAFIGISNSALDPAKMNRGIMVTRTEPSIQDLKNSAIGICSDKGNNNPVLERLRTYFTELASAYKSICDLQKREFFGLRDFYSLIKMLYWMSEETGSILTRPQLEHAVRRNFSGFDEFDAVAKFQLQELKNNELKIVQNFPCQFKQFKNKDVVVLQCFSTGQFVSINENDKVIFTTSYLRNAQFIIHIKSKGKFSLQSICKNSLWLKVVASNLVTNLCECELQLIPTQDKKATLICSYQQKLSYEQRSSFTQYHLIAPNDPITNPDYSSLGLISASLLNKARSYYGESRYLLFLTQHYSSLQVLKHYIVKKCLQDFKASQSSPEGSSQQAEPFVLFGSSFPKDKEFAQVCRNISEIRLCMKNGRMVILLNLENLYESLYDVLNQYYIKSGGHRYVDLGLRSNRTKCTVHPNFKLVLIAERERVYQEFPTPLINRLEKHFVDATTVLQPWQKDVCNQLDTWIETFLTEKFTKDDAFVGYSSDTNAAVVLQATYLADLENGAKKVLEISKRLLLQIASPDAIFRSIYNDSMNKKYQQVYFVHQEHLSLADLINRIPFGNQILLQVTTHTPTLSQTEFEELANRIEMDMRNMTRMHLEAFQTEQEFINSIDMMIRKGESHEHCVIFECERAHENGNLISCCRYCLTDKFREAVDSGGLNTRFVFLVHLPKKCLKSNFVSFQERPWLCYHVDAIFSTENSVPLNQILSGEVCSMSDIYYDDNEHDITDLSIDDSDVSDSQQFKSYQLLPYSEPQRINLCKRMYLQISKAASNPDQVNQLSQIIPQTILFPLSKDKITFHLQTIHLIKGILKDRELKEGTNVQQKWILDESMNMTKLQEAGTFQNAVVRKFDDIIIPIFAKIISVIDKYSNLKLLSKIETELEQLWLNLYNSDYVTQMIMSKLRSTPDDSCINATSTEQFFCQFPFCWILNDIVNENPNKDTEELITLLQDYGLFQSFESLPETTISSLARFYVHDFVHLLNTKGQPLEKDYYAMLEKCMIAMLAIPFSNELNVTSLFQIVVNVQKIYSENKSFFDLFSELIVLVPSTVHKMKSKPNDSNIEIHVLLVEALEIVLDSPFLDVKVPLMSKKEVSLQGWMQKQYESHRIIFSIVEECDIPPKVFLKWQWVCVMKLFFEYVVLQNQKETIIFARRIEKVSAKINDFEDSNALNIVAFLLSEIKKELKKLEVAKQQMIKISCWSFFLKVLSTLCIDGDIYDEELIDTLIQAVFSTTQNVKDKKLCTYLQNHVEEMTYLQSFTIKLIMQYEYNKIQSKLTNIMGKISSPNTQSFIGIFLANTKTKFSVSMQSEKMTSVADSLLGEGHRLLMQCKNDGALSPQCWLAVAKFTKGLEVLAKKIHESIFYMEADPDVIYLFDEAQSYCLSDDLNDDQTTEGPFWYLIRYIIRTFGSISLMRIFRNNYFKWILPSENFKDEEFIDFVAVYNPTYQDIRSAISRATTGEFDELDQAVKSLNPTFTVPLALALFERVKLSYATDIPSKKLSSEILENFRDFAKTCQLFTKDQEVLHIVDELLQNQQCSVFPSMQARKDEHEDSIYQMIVVHSVLTILANKKTGHMRMLSNFLSSPEALKDLMLPAMPIKLSSIKEEEEGFLQCNNGHQYTDIMLESFCIHCGRIIQYSSKSLAPVDKFTENEASFGYIPLNDMERNPPTGFLSNASYAIIRCIMHSCLLWSSCNGKNISPLMNGKLDLPLPEYNSFFWGQIKKDIQQLSSITGHSIDEAALLVHLVLKQINEKGHRVQLTGQNVVGNLVKLNDRRKWEEQFYDCYIESVVKDTGSSIKKMLKELTARDYSKLFKAVYMTPMTSSEPFLWNVCPTLTSQQICGQLLTIKVSEEHPVIFTYLSEVHRFEAMTFLPDIFKMLKITQKAISQFDFDEKTQGTIENMPFREFVNQIDDQQKDDYESYFVSFQRAWELCHHELNNGRLFELKNNSIQVEISKEMKMKYLIPTTYGPGVITTGLIDHLIISHNKFIRLCRKFVEDSLKKNWLWQSPKVPLQELSSKHFVKCSDEFVRLVQSHSVYTISNGNVTIQINDLGIIERDFVQEFVLGKPIITQVLDIPQVIWKRPVHNTQIIAAVKKNIPQQALPPQVRSGILMDLKDDLAEMTVLCETIETVMRFLQIKKEPAKKKLKEYVENDLIIIGKLRSEKITDFCCLEHVVPLWRFLNVERAKYRVRNEEDSFSVKMDFMEKIDDEQQKVSLEAAISKMTNIDNMLEVMYEMIQTYVQTCNLEDKHKQLREVLFDYVHQTKSEPISHLMEFFPPDIELSQVVCAWKEIVRLQDATKKKIR